MGELSLPPQRTTAPGLPWWRDPAEWNPADDYEATCMCMACQDYRTRVLHQPNPRTYP